MTAAFFIGLVVGGIIMSLAHYIINQHMDEQHQYERVWVHWYDPRHPEHDSYAQARLHSDPPPPPGPALVRRGEQ